MDDKKLLKECMGVVNQLYDLTDASVESRQLANDRANKYLFDQIKCILLEYDIFLANERNPNIRVVHDNVDSNCPICHGSGEYHTGGSFGGPVIYNRCNCTR